MWPVIIQASPKVRARIRKQQLAVIEEIHREFDTASDKALAQAKIILGSRDTTLLSKADRLKALGFISSETVVRAVVQKQILSISSKTASTITDYKIKYPFYKFILEEDVIAICKKYNLLCGPVSKFVGDIPEKNICDMEKFKVQLENIPYVVKISDIRFENYAKDEVIAEVKKAVGKKVIYFKDYAYRNEIMTYITSKCNPEALKNQNVSRAVQSIDFTSTFADEKLICAPKSDFNTKNMHEDGLFLTETMKVSYTKDPDPIVLQRVHDGFLIVTAWGLEASDPKVVNEVNN